MIIHKLSRYKNPLSLHTQALLTITPYPWQQEISPGPYISLLELSINLFSRMEISENICWLSSISYSLYAAFQSHMCRLGLTLSSLHLVIKIVSLPQHPLTTLTLILLALIPISSHLESIMKHPTWHSHKHETKPDGPFTPMAVFITSYIAGFDSQRES